MDLNYRNCTLNTGLASKCLFNSYLRTYEEAQLLIHAIHLKLAPIVTCRLSEEEKINIQSGCIFCFEENADGMKRWTDGKIWSPSRLCGEFLVYQEVPKHLSKNSILKKKKLNGGASTGKRGRKKNKVIDMNALHKKTVSVAYQGTVYHIISYFKPMSFTNSLMDNSMFVRLANILNKYPELKEHKFVTEEINKNPDFHKNYGLNECFEAIEEDKAKTRAILEEIACKALHLLNNTSDNQKFQT